MSATASSFTSLPSTSSVSRAQSRRRYSNVTLFSSLPTRLSKPQCLSKVYFKIPHLSFKRTSIFTSSKPFSSPVMVWQDCTVKKEIDVPVSVAYKCYSDREAIPKWMPFISTVKILKDKPDLSEWSLKYTAFGRDIEYSWLARNLQPIPNQKIHWRSMEGLPNRGAVRFFPKGPSSCIVELTVSYEVPQILVPVASALQPFLENLLLRGLDLFATYAKSV